MALPVTISSVAVGPQNSYHGPFKSSGGGFYTVLLDSGDNSLPEVHKADSDDPTTSFSEVDGAGRPDFIADVLSLNGFQGGAAADDLHVLAQNSSDDVYYARFDLSADAWDAIDGASDKDILVDGAPDGAANACDLVVRSDGDIIAVYQMEAEKVKGNPFERIGQSTSTSANRGETWSAVIPVDDQGNVERDITGPRIVLGDSDASHIVWSDGSDGATPTMSQRANSSADALQTERTDITAGDDLSASTYPIGHGVSFDRGGTTKIRFPYSDNGGDLGSLEFDAAADPSTFTQSSNIDGANNVRDNANSDKVLCLAVDGSTVHEMHARDVDSDLYTADDGDSDTWTSPVSSFTGTINHVSCNVYDRSGTKLAHIIDDGGVVKYDEDALAAGVNTETIAAIATGVPELGRSIFKTLDATASATPEINRVIFKSLVATAIGVATLEKVKLILQSIAAVATGVATLSRTIFKTLSIAATGVAAINRVILKTLRSIATSVADLVVDKLAGITNVAVAAVAAGVVSLQKTSFITLSVTATGAAALQRLIFKTLVATASGIAVLDPIKLAQIVLAAVATGVVTLTRTPLITLSATATGVADLARLIFKTLAATAVGTALLTTAKIAASGVTSVTIAAVATGVATINTLYVQFVVPFTGGSGLGMLDRTQTRWKRRARTWKAKR